MGKSELVTSGVIPARMSYLNVFEAKSFQGGTPKYSVSLIIPKSDTATLTKVRKLIKNATDASKFKGKIPSNFKNPLRDGDEDRPNDEAYASSYFIGASSKDRPKVVDRNLDQIIEPSEFYSGCYGNAAINFYAYDNIGKGIGCGLNHLQKLKDGDSLSGKPSVSDVFEVVDSLDDL